MSVQLMPTVVVLAAGRGERFARTGGSEHKLEAVLGGVPVLERVMRSVHASGLPFHIVRPREGSRADTDGMGDSIARGVAATAQAAGWLILPGDLPFITPSSLVRVASGLASHAVVLPFWNGQQGHPVGFDQSCGAALTALGGDLGAAVIVRERRQAGQVHTLHLDDPGIVTDIDTMDDLKQAEALLAAPGNPTGAFFGKR